jgi:hypothetical protein
VYGFASEPFDALVLFVSRVGSRLMRRRIELRRMQRTDEMFVTDP